MSDVSIGGAPVVEGDLLLPRLGNWTAYLRIIDTDTPPAGSVSLSWLGTNLAGYVLRSGISESTVSAILVGGAGGLWQQLTARHYDFGPSVGLVLQQILSGIGERLSATSTASVLAQVLPNWPRRAGEAGAQLDALADVAGAIWRVLPDGTVFFGTESWPAAGAFEYVAEFTDPAGAWQAISPEALGILPGQSLGGQIVGAVLYTIEPAASRARLWFQDAASVEDPLKEGLAALVRQELRGLDALALYPGKVIQQRGNGSLDVALDTSKLPPLTNVPIRVAAPGISLSGVTAGARVMVGFDSGDLRRSYASLWEGSGTATLTYAGPLVDVQADLRRVHDLGGGTAPTVATSNPNVQLGTLTGTDRLFSVPFTVVNNPAVGTLFTVTFAKPYGSPPLANVTQRSGSAVKLGGYSSTLTTIAISAGDQLPVGAGYEITVSTGG